MIATTSAAFTTAGVVLLALAAVAAVANWWAVWVGRRPVEWVAKPATLSLLVAVALVLTPLSSGVRAWFVVGLVCSLAGDVFLMLPRERFVAGLASFLLAHLAYVVGLGLAHESWPLTVLGLVVVLVAMAFVGRNVVGAVAAGDEPAFKAPVLAYMTVISAMVVVAFGTASPIAIGGALLFYVSDAVLAWNKFVKPFRAGRLTVMVTYHLGQAGLVWSLVR